MADFPRFFEEIASRLGTAPNIEPGVGRAPAPWVLPTDAAIDPYGVNGELLWLPQELYDLGDPEDWPEISPQAVEGFLQEAADRCPADAVAIYRPWHIYGDGWGIVVNEFCLVLFTEAVARFAGVDATRLAPWVLRQVLAHEYTHFAFEVTGTELEDVLGAPRYVDYVLNRFAAPNRWSTGPLEEVIATYAEFEFAKHGRLPGAGRRPSGYAQAVAAVNRQAGPGYRDFDRMFHPRDAERIAADVASAIADRTVWSSRWRPNVTNDETAQVPVYWQSAFDDVQELFGVLPKSLRLATVGEFERWIVAAGGRLGAGGKHAKVTLPGGWRSSYTKTAPSLLEPEGRKIAGLLGVSLRRLHQHIQDNTYPESLMGSS